MSRTRFTVRPLALAALAGAWGMALPACGSLAPSNGLMCVDDSAHCISERQAALKAMLADEDRKWVKERPPAFAHASGVRLFAFRSTKATLSCEQLALGRREAEAVPKALKDQPGLSPPQISRATLLARDVHRELAAEMKRRRCR